MIAPEQRKFRAKFNVISFELDVISFELDVIAFEFDVIANEVRKYSPNARRFETQADTQFQPLNAITIVQVKTKREAVTPWCDLNLQT